MDFHGEQMKGGSMEPLAASRASVRDFLKIIFKRRFQILLFIIVTFATVATATLMVKPVYEATAQILVNTGRNSIYVPATVSGNLVISINREEQINSEVEILKSKSLVKEVITVLGATSVYPELGKQGRGTLASIVSTGNALQTTAEKAQMSLHKKLRIQGIKKSNVISASFRHNDPQMAANVVNTLAHVYLVRHLDVHVPRHSRKFFLQQSEFLKFNLTQVEAQLEQLKQAHTVADLEEQQQSLLQRAHELRIALHKLNRIEETRISEIMDSRKKTSVSLIEAARVPLKPISPKVFFNLALGLLIAVLGGLCLAFFLHYLDDSLESVEDVEDVRMIRRRCLD
jgi:uncharacterized protein involved in exopolysaccharide biosynthesis